MRTVLMIFSFVSIALQSVVGQGIISIDEDKFKSVIWDFESEKEWKYKGTEPIIIDFYADWCAPCKALTPNLEAIQSEYAGKLQIYKVNTDKNIALTRAFSVRTIPTLFFVNASGKKIEVKGYHDKEAIKSFIQRYFSLN